MVGIQNLHLRHSRESENPVNTRDPDMIRMQNRLDPGSRQSVSRQHKLLPSAVGRPDLQSGRPAPLSYWPVCTEAATSGGSSTGLTVIGCPIASVCKPAW